MRGKVLGSMAVVTTMILGTAFIATSVQAQERPRNQLKQRVTKLENQNQRLKTRIRNINQRLKDVEDYLEGGGGSVPPPVDYPVGQACMLIAKSYKTVYLGKGDTMLDAEFNAHASCSKSVHSSHCTKGTMTCEAIPSHGKSVCVVTAKSYGTRYRAEGENELIAKYKALKSCGNSVHSSHCVSGTVKCETIY